MKSQVVDEIINYQDIPVNPELLVIEIPSWDAVAQPLIDYAKFQVQQATGQPVTELTDDHLVYLDLPVTTVDELVNYGIEVYKQTQIQSRFYYDILPYILTYYGEHTDVKIDQEELTSYIDEYMEQVQAYANQENLTLEEYGRQKMAIDSEDVVGVFKQRGHEDFIFKIIAQTHFKDNGGQLTPQAYEEFIQKNVLENQADEIELRARISFDTFKETMPEMQLSQEIYDYFVPQITFEINPNAQLSYR